MASEHPTTVVLFGATGDLSRRKLLPGLLHLFKTGLLRDIRVVCTSLDEYTTPFEQSGFEIMKSDNFCWIPHSAGPALTGICRALTPVLNATIRSRAMRSLVVARKPLRASSSH